jgi:topoisomerase IA-like protein
MKQELLDKKVIGLVKSTDNFIFIGRNKYGNYAKYRTVKRRLKKKMYLYSIGKLPLNSVVASRICYKNLCNNKLKI